MDKAALRAEVRGRRAQRSDAEQRAVAEQLAVRAAAFIPSGSSAVTCYASLPGEPGTAPLIATLLDLGHRVWLPRIRGENLAWVEVGPESEYQRGPLGISEPVGQSAESLDFADTLLIPALAVDATGRRLGQGGGYFDRALEQIAAVEDGGPVLAALVHDEEVVDEVPTEPHDRRVDAIITPTRTLRTGRGFAA